MGNNFAGPPCTHRTSAIAGRWDMRSGFTWAEICAFLAAVVWLASALIRLPRNIWFQAALGGGMPNEKLEQLIKRLGWQSRLNAVAAILTAAAVYFQNAGM